MNTIVIVTDSIRADFVSCYGNRWIKTDNFDRFSRTSMKVTHAYPEGLATIPVRTALFTGRYTLPFRGWQGLERQDVLLAETLWSKGIRTALIADTYHMHKPGMGFDRGFDEVQWVRGQESDLFETGDVKIPDLSRFDKEHKSDPTHGRRLEQYFRNISRYDWQDESNHFVAQVAGKTVEWIDEKSDNGDFFLWVDSFDPHEPWDPPEPYWSMYGKTKGVADVISPVYGPVDGYLTEEELKRVSSLYAGEITLVDKWIGKVFDAVEKKGLMSDTMVIWLSDHGEPLGEHGMVMKARPWPYEELIRIPMLIHHPEGAMDGRSVRGMVQTCDIMPTVLDFFNIHEKMKHGGEALPPTHGESMLPLLSGEKDKLRDYVLSGYFRKSWSVTDGNWKYITYLEEEATRYLACDITERMSSADRRSIVDHRRPELYNLTEDAAEKNNLLPNADENTRNVGDDLELTMRRMIDSLQAHDRMETPPHFDFLGRLLN